MAYITLADAKAYLKIGPSQTGDDTLLSALIPAAQAEIDAECGRTFEASADTTRYFGPAATRGQQLLFDKDLATITSVTNGDGTTIASSQYRTLPRNDTPYYGLELKSTTCWGWSDADSEIAVAGKWAFSAEAPAVIVQATKELVAYLYKLKDSQVFDVVASPETGTITVPKGMPQHVKLMLRHLKRRTT